MDPAKFKEQMSSLNYGNVMAAAARDYAKVRVVADFFNTLRLKIMSIVNICLIEKKCIRLGHSLHVLAQRVQLNITFLHAHA